MIGLWCVIGMPNIWFTADTHFGHGNIIKYCNRPFTKDGLPDPQAQDESIIKRFNEVLKPGDVLYHLGDVSWSSFNKQGNFLDRLYTREVHLIWGNHDSPKDFRNVTSIRSYSDIKRISIEGQSVVLCHYPMRTWNGKSHGAFQLYGHVHGRMPGIDRQMDVGVDTKDFYPWAWEEVRAKLKDLPCWQEEP